MRNPQERLGANNGFQEIKKHPWFKHVNWEDVILKKTKPQVYPVKKLKERQDRINMKSLIETTGKQYKTPNLTYLEDWDYERPDINNM